MYILGQGTSRNYKACCLGEAVLCRARMAGHKVSDLFVESVDEDTQIFDGEERTVLSYSTIKYFGFYDSSGRIKRRKLKGHIQLTGANDNGVTWPEIATFVRKYPEAVFSKEL